MTGKIVSRFTDHAETKREAEKVQAAIAAGRVYAGADVTTKMEDRPEALRKLQERLKETGVLDQPGGLNRAERRRREALARKAGRRAA